MEKEDGYDPTAHLSYGDLAVDNPTAPTVISIMIKKSKTDQGRKGVKVFVGKTSDDLCPVTALLSYLTLRGGEQTHYFTGSQESHCLNPSLWNMYKTGLRRQNSQPWIMQVTAFELGQQQLQQSQAWKIPPFKLSADGKVHHTNDILDKTLTFWHHCHQLWSSVRFSSQNRKKSISNVHQLYSYSYT